LDDFEKELRVGFLDEAAQLLADTEQCFLDLEKDSTQTSLLEKIFRLAHNLKGSAKAVGFGEMGDFTHQLESLLLKLKNGELAISAPVVSLLLRCNDHLRTWVDLLKSNLEASFSSHELLGEIASAIAGTLVAPEPNATEPEAARQTPAPPAAPTPNPSIANTLLDDHGQTVPSADLFEETRAVVQESLKSAGVTSQTKPPLPAQATEQPPQSKSKPATQAGTAASNSAATADENIRVSLKRLERLMNNVGELVILQTVLDQQKHQVTSPLVQKTISQLAKITKDIQDISMSLRMIPLKQTFQKMQRIVRDTSGALGKTINLHLEGEETELDKTVVEHLGDPLVHLIRNAVDHGIESTSERQALGKTTAGNVTLRAFHRGGQMVIEIQDDGKGLDAERLRAKAVEKGLLKPNQSISEKEAHLLIFAPGFSTKAEVTEISGRGVGMDVVRTNIEKILQGQIQVETAIGKGTCFRIILPLTLAIIDGMIVMAGPERFVVPIVHVHESLQPKPADVHFVSGVGEILSLRGEHMPLHRLSALLGRRQGTTPANPIAIVVRSGQKPFAVLVDDIIGQQQVVIKSLGSEMRGLKGVSGGAILGDGKASLILDLTELISRMASSPTSTSPTTRTQPMRGAA
jgi:two-component system chemotaxis sensor kinase CheA